jgi:uncharacterized membrane protein
MCNGSTTLIAVARRSTPTRRFFTCRLAEPSFLHARSRRPAQLMLQLLHGRAGPQTDQRLTVSPATLAAMRTSRLEAFSDGVLAIIITIMVLELHVPEGPTLEDLSHSATGFLTYLLSFVYIGIYWNNHHHMFQLVRRIDGTVLWANLHLLFWLSLYPFTTAWMDETELARTPLIVYGVNLLAAAIAYYVLQLAIFRAERPDSLLKDAVGRDLKGKLSPVLYLAGIASAYVASGLAVAFYVLVALIWLVPDRRMESYVAAHGLEA